MKNVRKPIALLLCIAMALATLTGCGGGSGSSSGSDSSGDASSASSADASTSSADASGSDAESSGTDTESESLPYGSDEREPVTLTVFSQLANWSGNQGGWSATLLKDMFNVELVIIPDTNGAYSTRMESGDLGDIVVFGSNGSDYSDAVNAGLLFDWEDEDLLLNYGQDILANCATALEANRELNADGAIYGIGHDYASSDEEHASFFYTWDIRWDLYKELGYPEVNDLDDLVELFVQMKELEPTDDAGNPTYAVSAFPDWDGNMVMYVKSLASAYYGYDELALGLYDSETGEFHDALEEDGPYLTALKFFNDLYQEGLLDPDSMTQTYDQMIAKVQRGGTFFSIFDYMGSTAYNTDAHTSEGKYMASLQPTEATSICYGLSTYGGSRVWTIGANCDEPERAMEIINWLYTNDGAMTTWYGIRGLMWDYDEDGNTYFTELGQACHDDPTYDLTGVEWTSPYTGETYTLDGTFNDGMIQINNTTWSQSAENTDSVEGESFYYSDWASQIGDAKSEIEQDWRDYTGTTQNQEYLDAQNYAIIPSTNYSESTRESELDVIWSQVTTAIKNGSWNAIYASSDEEFDSIVAQMISDCESYGYDQCIEWCENEAATRYALQ